MYKPNEQIDWIVLPIPKDFSTTSLLKKCISTSSDVLNLLKRNKIVTVQDLIDLPYEEIGAMRARVDQKTLVHSIKQELEEYFAPEVVAKGQGADRAQQHPAVAQKVVEITPETLRMVNDIFKAQYNDENRAYHLQDIWRNRYLRIGPPKVHRPPSQPIDIFSTALGVLERGLEAALISPIDVRIVSRRWFSDAVKALAQNPLRDRYTLTSGVDDGQNALANLCVPAFRVLLKWCRAVKINGEVDEEVNGGISGLKYIVEQLFVPRKGPFGIIINPEVDIVSTIREVLFPKGTNPRDFDIFERIESNINVIEFLPPPRKPVVLKLDMPKEKTLAILGQAVELKAKRDALRWIAESDVHMIYNQKVRVANRDAIEEALSGRGNSDLLSAIKLSMTVDAYANWNEDGKPRHFLVDEKRRCEILDFTKRIVKLIEGYDEDEWLFHRHNNFAGVRRYFPSEEELFEFDVANAMSDGEFGCFLADFRMALEEEEKSRKEDEASAAQCEREGQERILNENRYLSGAQEVLSFIGIGLQRHGLTKFSIEKSERQFLANVVTESMRDGFDRDWTRLSEVGFKRHEFILPRSVLVNVAGYPFSEAFFDLHRESNRCYDRNGWGNELKKRESGFVCAWKALADIVTTEFDKVRSATRLSNAITYMIEMFDGRFSSETGLDAKKYDRVRERLLDAMDKFSADVVEQERKYAESLPARSAKLTDRMILDAGGTQDVIDYMNSDPLVSWREVYFEYVSERKRFAEAGQVFEPGLEERILSFITTPCEEVIKDMPDLHGSERDWQLERTDDYKRKALYDLISIMTRFFSEEKVRRAKEREKASLISKGREEVVSLMLSANGGGVEKFAKTAAHEVSKILAPDIAALKGGQEKVMRQGEIINRNVNRHAAEIDKDVLRTERKLDALSEHEEVPEGLITPDEKKPYRCRAKGVKLEMLQAAYAIYDKDPHPGTAAAKIFPRFKGKTGAYASKASFTKVVYDYCKGMDRNAGIAPRC